MDFDRHLQRFWRFWRFGRLGRLGRVRIRLGLRRAMKPHSRLHSGDVRQL
jgi:hypothetical protein